MYATISQILIETTSVLYRFLSKILPALSSNWWRDLVVPNLTFQQQRSVRDKNINSLSGLDLAALLRILKRNWSQIRKIKNIPSDYIHYVNEMSDVRNRWAHAGIEEFVKDDIYRDLDTLQRFAHCIEAEIDHIEKIKKIKESIFTRTPFVESSKTSMATEARPRRKTISNPKTAITKPKPIDATRRPRNPELEASLKAVAGQLLTSELDEPFIYDGRSLLLFKRSGKRFFM